MNRIIGKSFEKYNYLVPFFDSFVNIPALEYFVGKVVVGR